MKTDPEYVPFHEAKVEMFKAKLINPRGRESGDGRRVEVWDIDGKEGVCLRLFRPTDDGKISLLQVALTDDAANALAITLMEHFSIHRSGSAL